MQKNNRGRPPKLAEDRKYEDLRIPVTALQKSAVANAAGNAGLDMAAWARGVLLKAAAENQVSLSATPQRPSRKRKKS